MFCGACFSMLDRQQKKTAYQLNRVRLRQPNHCLPAHYVFQRNELIAAIKRHARRA